MASFKVYYGKGIRRFQLPGNATFQHLASTIAGLYQVDYDSNSTLHYRDPEGDWVLISTTLEMHEAIRLAGQIGRASCRERV